MRVLAALCFGLVGLLPAQSQVEIWSPFEEVDLRAVLRGLEFDAATLRVVEVPEAGLADRVHEATNRQQAVILLGHGVEALTAAATRGLLDEAPEIPWKDPWIALGGPRLAQGEGEPKTLDDLLFDRSHHGDFALPNAEAAQALWAGMIAGMLREGRDEEYAFAWLRTLEAHALETTPSEAGTIAILRSGKIELGIVARSAGLVSARAEGRGDLRELRVGKDLPARGFGMATVLGTTKNTAARALLASLRSLAGLQAVAKKGDWLVAEGSFSSTVPPEADTRRWIARWVTEEQGKGRFAVSLEGWLDVAFCVVFAAFLLYAYKRLGKTEPRSSG